MSASKRQTTFAKMKREQAVRERRAKKLEKKRAAAAERKANESGAPLSPPTVDGDALQGEPGAAEPARIAEVQESAGAAAST
jgi:hypothetical protein